MPVFKYKANTRGNKIVSGLVEADNQDTAIGILEEKELKILSLKKKSSIGLDNLLLPLTRIKSKDIVIFSRQFSVLVSASVAMVQSLHLLVDQTENPKFKTVIAEIANEVDGGTRLSASLANRPEIFSNFYVNVVKSGETSGKLDEVLNYLADELEKDYDMTSKIRGAMIYPAFVLCGLLGVGIFMMIFVVPKLTAVITEAGTELPMATKILIFFSGFLAHFWWLLLILSVVAIFGYRAFVKIPIGKKITDTFFLHLPVFGKLFQKIYLVRFTRTMETLLSGGVNISKSLQISAEVVNNYVYKNLILKTKEEVEDGNSIITVFSLHKEIPNMVTQMLGIGEKTGKLDIILSKISNFYGREIDNTVANLMTLMEPIIMIILGLGVGTMVAAIIMPMYNMAGSV